jgi:Protein phosphatase 2C
MSWKAIARSSKGTSHKKLEKPCQDAGNRKIHLENFLFGAVADGAGSSKYSDEGADLAVDTALKKIEEKLRDLDRYSHSIPKNKFEIGELSEKEVKQLFTDIVTEVKTTLQEKAVQKKCSIDDLACTLSIVVGTPEWFAAMQIGDGFIAIRGKKKQEYEILFPPDKGEYINETTFVTSSNALNAMRVEVRSQQIEFICAATDGLERVAIDMKDWTPFDPFFQPLDKYMKETSDPETEDEIKNFLDSDRLNARTDDDKTLLLCFYSS